MTILITGAAGFIGFHVAKQLLANETTVVGIDNFNNYYDVSLKEQRWSLLETSEHFKGIRCDISDLESLKRIFNNNKPIQVIHLAAQAGVRHGIENPHQFGRSNLIGMLNILETCRHYNIKQMVYASSSSIYGANKKLPFSEKDKSDQPLSLYAATKSANELMAHSYSHLYRFQSIGLRFFTVYGPWGRPDMALFKFTKNISEGTPITVFNKGNMARDFTYIDDVVDGISKILDHQKSAKSFKGTLSTERQEWLHQIFNIGSGKSTNISAFIQLIETTLNKRAIIEYAEIQKGDVEKTWCDISKISEITDYKPQVSLEEGIVRFVQWYLKYQVNNT